MSILFLALALQSMHPVQAEAGEASADGAPGGEEQAARIQAVHQHFSATCFNECWNFIDKAQRSPEETEMMLLLANTSFWHWTQRSDATKQHFSVGYWQLSRVHALAGHVDLARTYGERCLSVSEEGALDPFYLGYAYEALARTEQAAGIPAKAKQWLALAFAELEKVQDPESRSYLEADLKQLSSAD